MAIDTLAMNLYDFSLLNDGSATMRERNVAYSMIKAKSIWTDIILKTDPILNIESFRYVGGLTGPDWQPLNSDPTNVKAVPTPYGEQAYAFANKIDIPILLLKSRNARGDLFDEQVENFLRALSYDMNDKFFNNNHGTSGDEHAPVGMRERLRDSAKYGTNSECKVNASVSYSDADIGTAANTNKLLRKMAEVMDAMGESEGDDITIFAGEDLLRCFDQGVRTLGAGSGFDMTKDAYGRMVRTYRNAKIRSAGRNNPTAAGVQAQILKSTESSTGVDDASSTYCSMFFVKSGLKDFHGWQFMNLVPGTPQKTDDQVTMRVVLHNAYGYNQPNTRAIGQLYGINRA